jgi:hypothetical protein
MPQPVSYNPGTPVSGSIQENSISYVVDGQNRNYRGGFGGLSWMSEVPAANNVIFIGNSTSLGRGPANIPLFYPSYNNSSANIVYAANTLPGSPRNFTTTGSAYNWAVTNNFFINNSNNPIPRIDADGLVLYVDANQPSSYPQINNTWYDLSGKNNNGTLTNGPTWNSNGWFQFDGVDDYVNCGNPSISTGKITVSALVNLNTFSNPGGSSHIVDSNSNSWHLAVLTNGVPYFWNGTTYHTTGTPLSTSRWYMLTGVQGTTLDIYVNGEVNNSLNSNVNVTTDNVWIGAWALANRFLNGQVSNTQIYPRALSQAEIKQNYFQSNIVQDGLVFMIDANNLVSYPKSGTTLYNLTGSSGNALLYNGPTYVPQYGGGINRDNTDDFISASISNSPTTNYSVETWFKANPLTGANYNALISAWNYPIGAGGWEFQFYNGVLGVHPTYTVAYTPNTVAHAVYTQNGTETKIYLNGVLQQTSTTSGVTLNNGSIGIGNLSAPGYGGYNLEGTFYNVRLYNKTLSSDEVQQNYQATKDKFQGQQIVTNGLVLNLDAANKDSYPGTGTTWYDLSTYGDNGTLINGVGFSPNVNSGVLNFDGVDDYVTVSNVFDFGSSNAMTAEIWAKSDNATWNDYGYLISRRNQFIIHPQLSSTQVYFYIYAGGYQSVSLTPASITGFNQYVLTYNNGDLRAYLNGSLGANASVGSPIDSYAGDTYIGKDDFLARYLDGSVGAVKLYNRALSATEVLQNYNAQKTRFGL